ncbi:hypothetical protein DFH06DRAFT_1135764 [Mycena polygramma]|nr:hypothetical protein DFH06DRAFT_1135764 [Mycena polygramma]
MCYIPNTVSSVPNSSHTSFPLNWKERQTFNLEVVAGGLVRILVVWVFLASAGAITKSASLEFHASRSDFQSSTGITIRLRILGRDAIDILATHAHTYIVLNPTSYTARVGPGPSRACHVVGARWLRDAIPAYPMPNGSVLSSQNTKLLLFGPAVQKFLNARIDMCLLAQLLLESLSSKSTIKAVRAALDNVRGDRVDILNHVNSSWLNTSCRAAARTSPDAVMPTSCYMSAWRTGRQLMPKGDKTESVGRVGHSPEIKGVRLSSLRLREEWKGGKEVVNDPDRSRSRGRAEDRRRPEISWADGEVARADRSTEGQRPEVVRTEVGGRTEGELEVIGTKSE